MLQSIVTWEGKCPYTCRSLSKSQNHAANYPACVLKRFLWFVCMEIVFKTLSSGHGSIWKQRLNTERNKTEKTLSFPYEGEWMINSCDKQPHAKKKEIWEVLCCQPLFTLLLDCHVLVVLVWYVIISSFRLIHLTAETFFYSTELYRYPKDGFYCCR